MEEKKIILPKQAIFFPIILGLSILLSTVVGSYVFYKVRSFSNAISVTGSANKLVTSDKVKWISTITRNAHLSALQTGYAQMDKDLAEVKSFLSGKGIKSEELAISPVFMDQIYDQNNSGDREYTLRQTFTINSENVSAITELSKNTQALIQKGVIFSTQSLEYYYSKLSEARVALMANAVKDARARAESLAESVGKKIGDLKSASSGVVQVLPPNSLEISDYGTYDTSTVDKQIMLTVRASFTLN